jgi:hypothetical protein
MKKPKQKISVFIGVSWHKQSNKWLAQVRKNNKVEYLGVFEKEEEAAIAYLNSLQAERMYSEEEVRELFKQYKEEFSIYRNLQILNAQFEEWFEKLKKK